MAFSGHKNRNIFRDLQHIYRIYRIRFAYFWNYGVTLGCSLKLCPAL